MKHTGVRIGVSVLLSIGMILINSASVFALGELPPAPDLCPNIDGAQASIPTGMILDGSGNCITPIPADTTGPVISGVANLSLATTEATIVWNTDELAISHFEYGTSQSYGTNPTLDATALLVHATVLTGLTANTTYYYCIHATDISSNANVTNSCGHSFTTAANPIIVDGTPPDISVITVAPITTTSVTINFTTTEVANAEIDYGTTAGYGATTPLDTNLALTHSVTLSNLSPNTLYHYRINTSDEIGNETISSDETFTTSAISEGEVVIVTPSDITAPVASDVGSISLGLTDATLGWTTNELATSTLEYGTTQSYGTHATLSLSALLSHTATLTGLSSGTIYYYCIHATDLFGNTSNSCPNSFTTNSASAPVDLTAPILGVVAATSVTATSTSITWLTNEASSGEVQYGVTTNYGSTTTDPILTLSHSVALTDLSSSTTYHYRVKSVDDAGNVSLGTDHTFTTEVAPSGEVVVNEPAPTNSIVFSTVETSSISTSTVTILWNTNLPADSQIEYGDSENFGSLTSIDSSLVTSHSMTLTGLSPNTNYIFRVKSKPVGVSVATISSNYEFNTLSVSTPVVPPANILSVSTSNEDISSATISWTTDKVTTSQVEYGISTSYGQSSLVNNNMVTSHGVTLSDLSENTTYHFRVKSIDTASNITYSEDYTFNTLDQTPNGLLSDQPSEAPAANSTLSIGGYDASSVELIWHATSNTSDAAQEYDIHFSLSPITSSNFGSATQAQLTPIFYGDLAPDGTRRTYIVAGLDHTTKYYFAFKSKYENTDYSLISNVVSQTTTSGASVNNVVVSSTVGGAAAFVHAEYGTGSGGGSGGSYVPTVVKAEGADNQIIFSWHNPGEQNFVRTVVVRKEGGYPTSPSDGTTVYEGRSETFTDTNVVNDRTYYYAVYSYNHSKTYSNGINISLAPKAGNKQVKFNESGVRTPALPIFHFTKVFKKGDKDIEIEHLQEILVADGDSYEEKYITGYFGNLTEKALKKFQAKHNLPQTGVTDPATRAKIALISQSATKLDIPQEYSVFTTDMKLGSKVAAVKALQQYLIYEGSLTRKTITGVYDAETKAAVVLFQKKYGIVPPVGYTGYKTRHKMRELSGL